MAAAVMLPGVAPASPLRLTPDVRAPGEPATAAVCSSGPIRCHAHVRITPTGEILAEAVPAAAPAGLGPAQIQSAYQIDPTRARPATVAIVDAFGYADLESDLATYPSTSSHTISVGGTALVRAGNARGWSETAWTQGGSSCAYTICARTGQSDPLRRYGGVGGPLQRPVMVSGIRTAFRSLHEPRASSRS